MFQSCLAEGGVDRIRKDIEAAGALDNLDILDVACVMEDSTLANIEGGREVETIAARWTKDKESDEDERLGKRIKEMHMYLPKGLHVLIERALRDARAILKSVTAPMYVQPDSDDDSSGSEEEARGMMADLLFGQHLRQDEEKENDEESSCLTPPPSPRNQFKRKKRSSKASTESHSPREQRFQPRSGSLQDCCSNVYSEIAPISSPPTSEQGLVSRFIKNVTPELQVSEKVNTTVDDVSTDDVLFTTDCQSNPALTCSRPFHRPRIGKRPLDDSQGDNSDIPNRCTIT